MASACHVAGSESFLLDRYHRPVFRHVPSAAQEQPMPNPYLHGNFAPVVEERSDDLELPVTGVIPPDLEGRLLRNGPNPAVLPVDESRLPLVQR